MTFRKPQHFNGKKLAISAGADSAKIDFNREKPTFCLRHIDSHYCISSCDVNEKASFADTLRNLSQLTWSELRSSPHRGMGCEKIARDALKRPIPPGITEDVTFLAFRFHGKKPMVGYRVNEMFHIIWFDRDFTLYDHG